MIDKNSLLFAEGVLKSHEVRIQFFIFNFSFLIFLKSTVLGVSPPQNKGGKNRQATKFNLPSLAIENHLPGKAHGFSPLLPPRKDDRNLKFPPSG